MSPDADASPPGVVPAFLRRALARQLLEHCGPDLVVRTTHQVLATELGSAREVISRLLKELEVQGRLELQRGSIRILDQAALELLAAR